MNDTLPSYDIVLLGAGHTNCHIIRMWRMAPIPHARLTCVSQFPYATYSGMLAGTLAGQYEPKQMQIDLVRLCAACNVRFIQASATGIDHAAHRLLLKNRPPIEYDTLSVGIGSRPQLPTAGTTGLSIKPMQTFRERLLAHIDSVVSQAPQNPPKIAIVGGGAAGVELALCLETLLSTHCVFQFRPEITLIEASDRLVTGTPTRTHQLAHQELERRGIAVRHNSRVRHHEQELLRFDNGDELPADIVIWATPASAPLLFDSLSLPRDEQGFLSTTSTLQSTGSDDVFVVGDSGSVVGQQYAKAGVYAVRQGPVLWENLKRKAQGRPLQRWTPQSDFLSLINTGDGRAILSYRSFAIHSKTAWRLKDWIDSRFMAKYQDYRQPRMKSVVDADSNNSEQQMHCGGCGSKAPAQVLQHSLPSLDQPESDHVLLGLRDSEDIALLKQQAGQSTAASIDFFSSFVDDPYLMGRFAALNALSDLFVKGSTPRAALSVTILPHGPINKQSALLSELLAGASHEFRPLGVPIVGGHSILGDRLTIGFTMLGDVVAKNVLRKGSAQAGDVLVLTKPLGTGVLLAAHMQAACRAEWWEPLIDSMLQSNQHAAKIAAEHQVSAATDITGFGLAGHLQEMLASGSLTAQLSLDALPLLPGVQTLFENGYSSTLAPSLRDNCSNVDIAKELCEDMRINALFDPQTSGGLLLAVPEQHVEGLLANMNHPACVIGRLAPASDSGAKIEVTL